MKTIKIYDETYETLKQIKQATGKTFAEIIDELLKKGCIVNNPFDRILSILIDIQSKLDNKRLL